MWYLPIQSGAYQRVKVEQHVALPWGLSLRARAALRIDRITKQKELLPGLPLLVLRDDVRYDLGLRRGGETEPQTGRAIVDDEWRVRAAMGIIWLGWWNGR